MSASQPSASTSSEPVPQRLGRFVGIGLRPTSTALTPTQQTNKPIRRITPIPTSLLADEDLKKDIANLPSNYSFELPKTIHRLRSVHASRVALQLPEGLLLYATTISDILRRHAGITDTVILSDVTYGACCVDDLSAIALDCDFLVHYGHSCLVPVRTTQIPTLYVFVHIAFDWSHLRTALVTNFSKETALCLVGTIQFVDSLHALRESLLPHFHSLQVPQRKPLSPGELLGCTAPPLSNDTHTDSKIDAIIYIGDGRFHLESIMIANPEIKAYRYDPYGKRITEEKYDHITMRKIRREAVDRASNVQRFGVVLGTLGRQGSPKILGRILKALQEARRSCFVILLSEITIEKLHKINKAGVQAWVQVACPRLSIDWGHAFGDVPLLTPYELFVTLGKTQWREIYPMDYYAKDGGEWTNYYSEDSGTKSSGRVSKMKKSIAIKSQGPSVDSVKTS